MSATKKLAHTLHIRALLYVQTKCCRTNGSSKAYTETSPLESSLLFVRTTILYHSTWKFSWLFFCTTPIQHHCRWFAHEYEIPNFCYRPKLFFSFQQSSFNAVVYCKQIDNIDAYSVSVYNSMCVWHFHSELSCQSQCYRFVCCHIQYVCVATLFDGIEYIFIKIKYNHRFSVTNLFFFI